MTENEIIKALEEYVKENEFEYFHSNTMGEYPLIRKALNFINRLQAQNKDLAETVHNLTIEKDALFDKAEELKTEVERLKDNYKSIMQTIADVHTEAVKEFAERLKEKLGDCHIVSDGEYCGFDCDDIHQTITNVLKEMVGEEK